MTRKKHKIFLTFLFAVNLVKTFKKIFSLLFSQWILTKSIRKREEKYSGEEANGKCRSIKMAASFWTHIPFHTSSQIETWVELLESGVNFPLPSSYSSGLQAKSGRETEGYQKKSKPGPFSRTTMALLPLVKSSAWLRVRESCMQ